MTLIFTPPEFSFEDDSTSLIEISSDTTDFKWGKIPTERTIEELLDYGIINLDKPPRPTSHEVVSYVKKMLNLKKAGHSGTLDPLVTGVLPIALGRATKILGTLLLAGKEYVCNMRLHQDVKEERIREIMKEFVGDIYQRPPFRSSVKRVLRVRTVYENKILEIKEREVLFWVRSQAGFYVRKYCLHPNTQILTTKGSFSIEKFVESPKTVFSLDNGEIITKTPSAVQKIRSKEKLYKFEMKSGISFTITSDHEMLKSTLNGYEMVEARNLAAGDYLVKSLDINLPSSKICILDLLDDEYLIEQEEIKEKCKTAFIKKYGSIREMSRKLRISRQPFISSSKYAIKIKHLKLAGIYEETKNQVYRFKQTKGQVLELKELTEPLLYILGLVASDGNNSKEKNTLRHTRIYFHNTHKPLIDKFITLYEELFPNSHYRVFQDKNEIWGISLTNSLLACMAATLGIRSPKKESDFSPLLMLEPNLIKSYLRGYFDGDGSVQFKEYPSNVKSRISLYTVSENEALILHKLLLKLKIENNIFSSFREFKGYKSELFAVAIGKIGAELRFINEIGTEHLDKQKIFDKFMRLRAEYQDYEYGDTYNIGFHFTNHLNPHKTELKKLMGGNLDRVLEDNTPITRRFYKTAGAHVALPKMDKFIIEEIKSIEEVPSTQYVYDMTIPVTHNFLIETGFVSSNCHDIGQSLACGAHMKELRRVKSGPFSENKYLSSLQDLFDAYMWLKEENDEIPIRNIILPMELGVSHLPKIYVKDSTIDSLCHGAPLAIPGISKFTNNFTKGEMVGIFSLKHELVGLGEAQLDSKDLIEKNQGLAASIKRVVMETGTYPSKKKDS